MCDDDIRNESSQGINRRLFIFIDVDYQMRRAELPDFFNVNVFGAADFRDGGNHLRRMNAKAGTPHQTMT